MISQLHLSALIWAAGIIWAALLVFDGTNVSTGLFKPCSTVVAGLGLLLLLFDKWIWRFRILHPWFVDRPNIRGTWKGQLISTWVDPQTGTKPEPIDAYLVIRQTFSGIHMRLITRESSSESLADNIPKDADGVYSVASIYRNTPKLSHRPVSPIHNGGLLLRVLGDPVSSLEGHYWTDRGTQGEVVFHEKSDVLFFDFATASSAVFKKPG